jgi:hypothetical protein
MSKYIIIILLVLMISTAIHDLFHRRLIYDDDNDYSSNNSTTSEFSTESKLLKTLFFERFKTHKHLLFASILLVILAVSPLMI